MKIFCQVKTTLNDSKFFYDLFPFLGTTSLDDLKPQRILIFLNLCQFSFGKLSIEFCSQKKSA